MPETKQSITVLVVESGMKNLAETKGALQGLGVSPENILATEDTEKALDLLMERAVMGERERILFLLCDVRVATEGDGVALMELVKTDIANPPYIVAMGNPDEASAAQGAADAFLAKGTPDFYGSKLKDELMRAKGFASTQVLGSLLKSETQKVGEASEMTQGASEEFATWQEGLGHMPDLRKSKKPEATNHLSHQLVAVLDLDGTLAKAEEFAMEGLVNDFTRHPMAEQGSVPFVRELPSEFEKWISEIPDEEDREKNKKAADELKVLFKEYKDGKWPSDKYEDFLETTNILYGKMLKGVKVREVFQFAEKCCLKKIREDHRLYSDAKPLVAMLKELGVVPTLISGAPAEAIAAFRKVLGIEERCYPMELSINQETGRYTGDVRYHTGIAKVKNMVIDRIVENDNRIIFAAGDQGSDEPLLRASLSPVKDGVMGLACFFGKDISQITRFSDDFANRRALAITRSLLRSEAILEWVAERFGHVSQLEINRVLPIMFVEKINFLLSKRSEIKAFFNKSEEDLEDDKD